MVRVDASKRSVLQFEKSIAIYVNMPDDDCTNHCEVDSQSSELRAQFKFDSSFGVRRFWQAEKPLCESSLNGFVFIGESAWFRLYPRACQFLRVCVCFLQAWAQVVQKAKKIKIVKMTFADFDICYRMASLRKLYSPSMTCNLKVKKSKH